MRIIKDETQKETIVKCPECKSIFSYTEHDIYNKYTIDQLRCPCCDTNHMVWEYKELEVDNIED